jgi:hypothetical protein
MIMGEILEEMMPSLKGIIRDQAKPLHHLKNVSRKSTRKLIGRTPEKKPHRL